MGNYQTPSNLVLLTGATGYVGGRLLPALEAEGVRLRCVARHPDHLRSRVASTTQVVQADVLDLNAIEAALAGVDVAYYLIHAMGSTGDFEREDRVAAHRFAAAARSKGVRRIIYLGGLGGGSQLSPHLRSRHEVGEILRSSGVPTLEFRTSIVIGSGSLSFEMVRALTEKLPIMVTPRWVRTPAQPIAIEDLIAYLVQARGVSVDGSHILEVGGADQVSYGDIMTEYARQRGLRRVLIPVPVLTPALSSLWLVLVTPVYARVGRKLLDSVRNPTVVEDRSARNVFPDIHPRGIRAAVARALSMEDRDFASTRWSDALSSAGATHSWAGTRFRSRIVDSRTVDVPVDRRRAFAPIRRIGGRTGWYYGDWMWHVRGLLDLLVGGVGIRRGRRDPEHLVRGDTVDCWRVEAIEPDRRLRLAAEMKIPGRAWLEFEVERANGGTRIRQTAEFDPAGVFGLIYWYALYVLHRLIFAGMLQGIADAAVSEAPSARTVPDTA